MNTFLYHLHVESKKYNKRFNKTKKKQIYREQMSGNQWGEGSGEGHYRCRGCMNMVFCGLEKRRKKYLFRCQRDFQLGEVYGVKMALLAAQQ